MEQFKNALKHVLLNGSKKTDRTGVGTISSFGYQMRFNLQEGFPATTTKKLAWKAVVSELLWFLEGSNDERRLCEILYGTRSEERTTIWSGNANADYWRPNAQFPGDLGKIYGAQWRSWGPRIGEPIDQIAAVLKSLKDDPFSRRHIVSAWNPGELNDAALPPCHALFQFNVRHIPLVDRIKMSIKSGSLDIQTEGRLDAIGVPKYYLDCQLYQRSCDMFLGVPFNIASYSLLIHMFAKELNYAAGDFVWTGGDCHIYATHLDAVHELLDRECRTLPTLEFNKKDLANYKVDDFKLVGYDPHPVIKAPMAV